MNELPDDLLTEILLRVNDSKSLARCSLVCSRWARILDSSSSFWPAKCKFDGRRVPERLLPIHAAEFAPNRVDYRLIWMKNPYGRNLIKNDSGQERFKHWEIEPTEGWQKWDQSQRSGGMAPNTMQPIEKPPGMADDAMPDGVKIESCFATSHFECTKTQTIDLWKEGVEEWILNRLKPSIVVSEWHAARRDCGARYAIDVSICANTGDRQVMDTFEQESVVAQWAGGTWEQSSHEFQGYPGNIRYVKFTSSGRDTQFWAGFYGAKMAKASVTLDF